MSFGSLVTSSCHDYFHPIPINDSTMSPFSLPNNYSNTNQLLIPADIIMDNFDLTMTNSSGNYYGPSTHVQNVSEYSTVGNACFYGNVRNCYNKRPEANLASCYPALKACNKNRLNMIGGGQQRIPLPKTRVIKRRVSANKKERRRTLSINTAFSDLREHIPFIPPDTKLSKIKTLRLATSYISYLMDFLQGDDDKSVPENGFQTIVTKTLESREERRKRDLLKSVMNSSGSHSSPKKSHPLRNRTGWPQHVWVSELNHSSQLPTQALPPS